MKPALDIHDILKLLPHRHPFIMIDRVLEIEKGKSIVAIKNVSMNEPFFTGHFPGRPVMPGVLIIEALAQAGAVLAYVTSGTCAQDGVIYYFAGIDNARFRRVVEPGDQLRLAVEVTRSKRDVWKLTGSAYVGDELAASADFMSAKKSQEFNHGN